MCNKSEPCVFVRDCVKMHDKSKSHIAVWSDCECRSRIPSKRAEQHTSDFLLWVAANAALTHSLFYALAFLFWSARGAQFINAALFGLVLRDGIPVDYMGRATAPSAGCKNHMWFLRKWCAHAVRPFVLISLVYCVCKSAEHGRGECANRNCN